MLADEMGLGKTVQSVTTLHHIWFRGRILWRGNMADAAKKKLEAGKQKLEAFS